MDVTRNDSLQQCKLASVVAVMLALIISCTGVPLDKTSIGARFIEEPEPHPACLSIQGVNEADTLFQRENCELVYRNEYIRWSEEMLADEEFASKLQVIDVTDLGGNNTEEIHSRIKRSTAKKLVCPRFDDAYLASAKSLKQRSTSPWEFVILLDRNRKPKKLIDTKCLCKGCIDISTGVEDMDNLTSEPLSLVVPVQRNGELHQENVHIGCTCMIRITVES